MTICSAKNCINTVTHKFPADSERREQWKSALRRKDWLPSKYSRLCSVHFKPEDFYERNSYTGDKNLTKVLRKTAVPPYFLLVKSKQKIENSAVPHCRNTSIKAPNKLFVYVPQKKAIRDRWLKLARRDKAGILPSTTLYFCEDHFDVSGKPPGTERPTTSTCTSVTAGVDADANNSQPRVTSDDSKKTNEVNKNKMFLTIQPISFRCRMCAKNSPYDDRMQNLSHDKKAKRGFIDNLKYFGDFYKFFGDFRNKFLPDIVCGACFDALNASHNFFLKMVYAKLFFNQLARKIKPDNEDPLGKIATEDNEIEIQEENDIDFAIKEHDIKSDASEDTVSIKSEPIDDNDIEIKEEHDIYVNQNDTLINKYDNDISIEDHNIKTEIIEDPMMVYEEDDDSKSEIPHFSKTGQKSTIPERMDITNEDITDKNLVSAEKLDIPPRNMSSSKQGYYAIDQQIKMPQEIQVPNTKNQFNINPKIEKKLIKYLKFLKERRFCFTLDDVVATLLKLYDMTDLPHPFKRGQIANDWCVVFLESNTDILSEHSDPNDRPFLMTAFDIYRDLVSSLNLGPDRIYNAVESAAIGLHESEFSLNAVCGISASGTFIPPIVFVKNHDQDQKLNYKEPTVVPVLDATVRMTANRYLTWLKHFQKHTQSSVKNKAILITNGHPVHKDILALNFAKENGIELFCLNVFLFQPLADFYEELQKEFTKELKKVKKNLLQSSAFVNIFFYVYYKMATMEIACKGFEDRGLWPIDSDVFLNVILEYRRKHTSV